jgi:hypothetical protein
MFRTTIACTAIATGLLLGFPRVGAAALDSVAQSSAQVTPADAEPFMGDWTLTLQGPNGPGTFALTVKLDKEKVVGEITNEAVPTQPITDITKNDKSLLLRYTFNYEGNPVDAVVSLTPAPEGKVNAQIDFAGGAYVMSGTAAKKEKSKQ